MKHEKFKSGGAFTLTELLMIIAFLGTLAGAAAPVYKGYIDRARTTKAIEDIAVLQKRIEMYKLIHKTLPRTLGVIDREGFLDPYGRPYRYMRFSEIKEKDEKRRDRWLVPLNRDYDLYSMGEDGKSQPPLTAKASNDDIVRANDGRFIGRASEF